MKCNCAFIAGNSQWRQYDVRTDVRAIDGGSAGFYCDVAELVVGEDRAMIRHYTNAAMQVG